MDAVSIESTVAAASRVLSRHLEFTRVLTGGQHAQTVMASDGKAHYVVRTFDAGDDAAEREVAILCRLDSLGPLTPKLLGFGEAAGRPMIVTSALPGGHLDPAVSLVTAAEQMAGALAAIHRLDGTDLRQEPRPPQAGLSKLSARAVELWNQVDVTSRVLTHFDFWCGNALWDGEHLIGVVDWSGARSAPRGVDVAWCRQDFVLLGSPAAADRFLEAYEQHSGHSVPDVGAWDVLAAEQAHSSVESWGLNYRGVGREDITSNVLRQRFDAWTHDLMV
ncbi:MAG TPA: aminoglycoside phosphotransferase family protein [Plantibacter sp.]|uniref:phosphotransferase family protein n=1 Tax=unclassified Plantibacter TaxID=2624265 RepID=UPI002BCE2E6E|nr:aminoglycoside phosphotransferase family protein [Plantibacter sp.]